MKVRGKVIQPDGNGVVFLDKPSLEIRFGEPNPIRFVSGGSILHMDTVMIVEKRRKKVFCVFCKLSLLKQHIFWILT
jgi:hypothetical protein